MTIKYFKTLVDAKKFADTLKLTGIYHTIEIEEIIGIKRNFNLYKVTIYNS